MNRENNPSVAALPVIRTAPDTFIGSYAEKQARLQITFRSLCFWMLSISVQIISPEPHNAALTVTELEYLEEGKHAARKIYTLQIKHFGMVMNY